MSIGCHSAFKHYEMFHSGGWGGGFSSTSNTTYNINCGGHGGFWSGFGMGLGNAFGGIFSGMFGGGNMFGNPFAFNWGGSSGSIWGGGNVGNTPSTGNTNNTSSTHSSCHCSGCSNGSETTSCSDIDSAKLATYMPAVTNLEKRNNTEDKPNKKAIQDLYDKVKADKDKQDNIHKTDDTEKYGDLLNRLKRMGATDSTDAADGDEGDSDSNNQVAGNGQGENGAGSAVAGNGNSQVGGGNGTGGQSTGVTDGNGAGGAGGAGNTGDATHEYANGLQNVTENDLSSLRSSSDSKRINFKAVIDTSDKKDFGTDNGIGISNVTISDSGRTIEIKLDSGANVTYKYSEINEQGEMIFKSEAVKGKVNGQEYILQKDSNGDFRLMQYCWNHGHNDVDVH